MREDWRSATWASNLENSAARERYFCSMREQFCSALMSAASALARTVSSSCRRPRMNASAFAATAAPSPEHRENSSSERKRGIACALIGEFERDSRNEKTKRQ